MTATTHTKDELIITGNDYHIYYGSIYSWSNGREVAKIHFYRDNHMKDEIREIEMIEGSHIMCHQLDDFNQLVQHWNLVSRHNKLEGVK